MMTAANNAASCPDCHGFGEFAVHEGGCESCKTCDGSGKHPRCGACDELLIGDDLDDGVDVCSRCLLVGEGRWTEEDEAVYQAAIALRRVA